MRDAIRNLVYYTQPADLVDGSCLGRPIAQDGVVLDVDIELTTRGAE